VSAETTTVNRGGPSSKVVALVALSAAALIALAVVLLSSDDSSGTAVSLADVPQGVSARVIGEVPVFVVRDDAAVSVFATDARHLAGDHLWWCPREEVFVDVEHGSQFAIDGLKIGGPAEGGLNEYPSSVSGDSLTVNTDDLIEGKLTPVGQAPAASRASSWQEPYDSGLGSGCEGAVRAP
jgi:hypothetical protein